MLLNLALNLALRLLKPKVSRLWAITTRVGEYVEVKGVAHGVKLYGMRWRVDMILCRTK